MGGRGELRLIEQFRQFVAQPPLKLSIKYKASCCGSPGALSGPSIHQKSSLPVGAAVGDTMI